MVLPAIAVRAAVSGGARKTAMSGATRTGTRSMTAEHSAAKRDGRYKKAQEHLKSGMTSLQKNASGKAPSALVYIGALAVAIFKDMLDLIGVGSLPALGTIVTIFCTALIWIIISFDDVGNAGNMKMMRGIVLVVVGILEGILFGLNLMPIESLTVMGLYVIAKNQSKG
jgi:hypothetical protein